MNLPAGAKVKINKESKRYKSFLCCNAIPQRKDCPHCPLYVNNISEYILTVSKLADDRVMFEERNKCWNGRIYVEHIPDDFLIVIHKRKWKKIK